MSELIESINEILVGTGKTFDFLTFGGGFSVVTPSDFNGVFVSSSN